MWARLSQHVARLADSLNQVDSVQLGRAAELLRSVVRADGSIFVAGNGGSSATASHWANDLRTSTMGTKGRGVRAWSLADNIAMLTALANDEGYESVFCQQLATHLRPGDLVAVISVSGSSPNLVRAIEFANELGIPSIGLLGWDGGKLATMVTTAVVVPAPPGVYPLVESAHSLLCDVLCQSIVS